MRISVDTIHVYARDIAIDAEIGVNMHEQGVRQPLYVDIDAEIASPSGDELEATIDYRDLLASAEIVAGQGHVMLIETFASAVARRCLAHLPGPGSVKVEVRKPWAIAPAQAGTIVRMSAS